ncbi:hypothetical protein BFG57_11260 [Bacillus solimangrovi]|uniref:EamA domain-containing protein n=2 Tax=Bacillus solimangrovi TaxID=1305675 RepID=A0A1E5LI79_9BACI|nr:DMT family transporter [Bacillus solimangrovi]OEH93756.1 hypothetical protein BFG57_11260 [Bacillus solimangrovi]
MYVLLLLVPLFWGGAFGAAKHIITEVPPITAATLRFGSASLILLVLVLVRSKWDTAAIKKQWIGLMGMAVTGIFLYNVFFFIALKYTSAINGSLIMATTPVFITFGAVFFLNEVFNKRLGFGLFLSLFGVLIVIFKGSIETLLTLSFNSGDLLFVAALACWVIHGLIAKVVMKDVSSLLTTTVSMLVGSVFLAICSIFEGGWTDVATMSFQSWLELAYMSILASVIAFILWNEGIKQIGTSKSSMYMNLVPINAAWISVIFYGSTLHWQQLIGMLIVIVGVFIATSRKHSKTLKSNPLQMLQR